jgi:hypothetical protein
MNPGTHKRDGGVKSLEGVTTFAPRSTRSVLSPRRITLRRERECCRSPPQGHITAGQRICCVEEKHLVCLMGIDVAGR